MSEEFDTIIKVRTAGITNDKEMVGKLRKLHQRQQARIAELEAENNQLKDIIVSAAESDLEGCYEIIQEAM